MRLTLLFCLAFIQLSSSQIQTDTLKVGYTLAPPFIVENNDRLEGINIWLWEKLCADLNLDYELVRMDFSEMLDSLSTGGIDVSINPLTITAERDERMDFSQTYYASNSTIAVKKLSSFQKLYSFIKGFLNVNFLRGFMFLILIILFFGMLGWYFERKRNPEDFRTGWRGLWDGLWWSAVTLTTVGYGDKAPRSSQGKVVALILMFTGLLFISGLTASIASSLTVNELSSSTENFSEFKAKKVGSIRNSSSINFLKSHFFRNVNQFSSVKEGLDALYNDEVEAFMYDEPILRYHIKQTDKFSDLQVLPIEYDLQFYAFGIAQSQKELRDKLSQGILKIIESKDWEILLNEYDLSEL